MSHTLRVFLLSPARLDGARARLLFDARQPTGLAAALRTREGAPIGEVFRFISSLYFRGKLAYGTRFARPPAGSWVGSGALVMTTNRGLIPAESRVVLEHLLDFARTDIHSAEDGFRGPLTRDAERLGQLLEGRGEIVLLGSVASKKYVDPLLSTLGERLLFPPDFVGRGDMSRGGLMLRAVEAGAELRYSPVQGATLTGARPPRLPPKDRG